MIDIDHLLVKEDSFKLLLKEIQNFIIDRFQNNLGNYKNEVREASLSELIIIKKDINDTRQEILRIYKNYASRGSDLFTHQQVLLKKSLFQ